MVDRRRPVHVGTRSFTDNQEATKALIAIPLLRGETLERLALDCLGVTTSDETNLDQPPIFSWVGGFIPWRWGGDDVLDTAQLDAEARKFDTIETSGTYLGGEPNPSGDTDFGGADWLGDVRVNFRRNVLGDPIPVGQDSLDNTDARFIDRFRTVINRPMKAENAGVWIFAARSYRMDAQSDFGVAEIDDSISPQELALAYANPFSGAASPQIQKAVELIFGGDNHIEADSLKETGRRQYAIARPAIRMSENVGRLLVN